LVNDGVVLEQKHIQQGSARCNVLFDNVANGERIGSASWALRAGEQPLWRLATAVALGRGLGAAAEPRVPSARKGAVCQTTVVFGAARL
jgi:hypothetical protein